MKKILLIFALFVYLSNTKVVNAIVDPNAAPNNKYGIHIIDENDLYDAANLVNSSGGDWGYVTMVISDKDRSIEKWQKIMELMRSWHLIPIIRLATHLEGDTWVKPIIEDSKEWVDFLINLHWVTKNRYIIFFNEPNHAKEWGGEINPAEYARILTLFSQNLKNASPDFFILPAGLDASAPNGNLTMEEEVFLRQMIKAQPDVFSYIDGWTSHSYPNPGFAGKVTGVGKGTIRTYSWEMETLKSMGQKIDLPIFITETGWPHTEGIPPNNTYLSANQIGQYIKIAAEAVWNDPQIVVVSPFVLNYQSYPFSNFSWKKVGGGEFYEFYDIYKQITKVAGKPELARVFEKFEGLKIKDISDSDEYTKMRLPISLFSFPYWRSIFYRVFKL